MYSDYRQKADSHYEHMKLGGNIDDEPNATDKKMVVWTYGFLNFAFRKISTKAPDDVILSAINKSANSASLKSIKNTVVNEYKKASRHITHHTSQRRHQGDNILDGMLLYASSYEADEKELNRKICCPEEDMYWDYIKGANYAAEKMSKWHRVK